MNKTIDDEERRTPYKETSPHKTQGGDSLTPFADAKRFPERRSPFMQFTMTEYEQYTNKYLKLQPA